MSRFLGYLALILLTAQMWAQGPRPRLISAAEAQQFEASLNSNPNDKAARGALLNYYFVDSRLEATSTIQARRRPSTLPAIGWRIHRVISLRQPLGASA